MIFVTTADFYAKAAACTRLSREEELDCARRMKSGDTAARQAIIESYLPSVAAHLRRTGTAPQELGKVLYCMQALEKAVDGFNFFQDSETFSHRLSWYLRQATVRYIAR